MKKLLAIVAFAFIGIATLQAQEIDGVPSQLTESMISQLGLDANQTASVTKILSVIQPAMQTIQSSNLSAEDKVSKLNAYADREKMNMKNLLTDAQFVKYLELTGRI